MTFQLFDANLTRAEGEEAVRTYHCTSLSSRLLGMKAEGHLTVTNKRVVFYAHGSSYSGKSILHSEVPVADVSGISSYKGNYFGWMYVLTAVVVSIVVGGIIGTLVMGAATLLWSALDLESPQIIAWVLGGAAIAGSLFVDRQSIWRTVLAFFGAVLFAGAGSIGALGQLGRSLLGGSGGMAGVGTTLAFVAGIYVLVCLYWYARRETMAIYVSSKGGASTPIAISGVRSFGAVNTAATRALTAEPAPDSEVMIKQLGAMITDIQALGDFGIEKWTAR